jgi:tRNA splicing ligase
VIGVTRKWFLSIIPVHKLISSVRLMARNMSSHFTENHIMWLWSTINIRLFDKFIELDRYDVTCWSYLPEKCHRQVALLSILYNLL